MCLNCEFGEFGDGQDCRRASTGLSLNPATLQSAECHCRLLVIEQGLQAVGELCH